MDFLMLIKYILLGLLQGLTEPIPVSSSGHLVLAQHFLGLNIEGFSFELLMNAGSLIAVLLVYKNDIFRLAVNGLSYVTSKNEKGKADFRFIIYLIIATIPAGVIGVLFDDEISAFFKDGVRITAVTLLITGLALFLIRNLRGRKNDGEIRLRDAVIIGLSQMVALVPGISRSGATIVPAMALGLKSETALRFSFLLYIPVSLGGTILSITDIFHDPRLGELFLPYLFAFIASVIATYFSLRWFMNIMAKGNLVYFSIYCFVIGIAVLIFA